MKTIPKSELKNGHYYIGHCRNSNVAMWSEELGQFVYLSPLSGWAGTKFGIDYILHEENKMDGFDYFSPYKEILD